MEELIFDCHALREFSSDLGKIHRDLSELSDRLDEVWRYLDPQIKSYAGINQGFRNIGDQLQNRLDSLSAMKRSLMTVCDLYDNAENEALRLSRDLPTAIGLSGEIAGTYSGISAQTAAELYSGVINSRDLVIEPWLSELLFKNQAGDES